MNRSPASRINWIIATLSIFIAGLASCEKEVHISLGSSPSEVVVEGAIETNVPPYVFLTSTVGFFNTININTLQGSFLHGATITVSDGSRTIPLREYSFDTGGSAKFYIYSIDTATPSQWMLGEVGKFYTLSVTYNGKTYTAVTKIPSVKGVDTAWFDKPLFANSKTPDSAKQLFVNYTDPDTPGNYARYFTSINGGQFYAVDQFNDEVVNGTRLTKIPLYAGFAPVQNAKVDSLRYFYPGEKVILKWAEIDKRVYDFWNSFNYANNILGNPFASPINLKTNLTNGALGVWAGYGTKFDTLLVP